MPNQAAFVGGGVVSLDPVAVNGTTAAATTNRPWRISGRTGGFLVNSVPKAGTNLLKKMVQFFPGVISPGMHLWSGTTNRENGFDGSGTTCVTVGVDWPRPVHADLFYRELDQLSGLTFATAHLPFTPRLREMVHDRASRMLLVIRDPRDVAVSHAHYIAGEVDHFLHPLYRNLTLHERITRSIEGLEPLHYGGPMLLSIKARFFSVLPWTAQPLNLTTAFELLVGPEGGGERRAQLEQLERIGDHLGIQRSGYDPEVIARRAFGGTHTFRRGIIGGWREQFTSHHKAIFKEIAGQLLIDLGYEQDYNW